MTITEARRQRGGAAAHAQFAFPPPMSVIGELLGLDPGLHQTLRHMYEKLYSSVLAPQDVMATVGALAHACHAAGGDNFLTLLDAGRSIVEDTADTPPADFTGLADAGDLRAAPTLLGLVRARQHRLRAGVAREIGAARARGEDEFSLWDTRYAAVRDVGGAHGITRTVEAMVEHLDSMPEPRTRELFGMMIALFTLERIHSDFAGYAAGGILAPADLVRVDVAIDELCRDIAPWVGDLVDAFGMSPDYLRAPIGKPDFVAAFAFPDGTH